jgi:uncharacterized membrane protein YeaQ/YmgE (transglycosylase-associated protein family)
MLTYVIAASIGCFTGIAVALALRAEALFQVVLDAVLGSLGGITMASFIAPIAENATDLDRLNIAAIIAAPIGALVLLAIVKAVRGK